MLWRRRGGSIHPQGWVPIETDGQAGAPTAGCALRVAFTPKGGCLLKRQVRAIMGRSNHAVAFTPKGGCPLKRKVKVHVYLLVSGSVAFTPKGGCPLKPCVSASGGTDARTW